jgi:hypothetical protein
MIAAAIIVVLLLHPRPRRRRRCRVNRGVVQLETPRAAGISVRIAEDPTNIIDDGATRQLCGWSARDRCRTSLTSRCWAAST